MRKRLRPAHSPEALADLYATRHDYHGWKDHLLRVPTSTALVNWMLAEHGWSSVADLSCGEGATVGDSNAAVKILGDITPGHPFHGPIEDTIHRIPPVDLFVCDETIEHLDDPDAVLVTIRGKAQGLICSTPVGSWDDPTLGHYWAWEREDVEAMLTTAGWRVETYMRLEFPGHKPHLPHDFGIWGCS
jgi:hypothetical protein